MNYTWFASAYDNDDTTFRLLTMVMMGGALMMASGVDRLFATLELKMIVLGYVVIRVAMLMLWLRAGLFNSSGRRTALSYAIGIAAVQLYWVGLLLFEPGSQGDVALLFAIGAALELLVPAVAERHGQTPWHRHHIVERFGLLTIIVLGEALLSASLALRAAIGEHDPLLLARVAFAALVIVFAMWWVYFSKEEHLRGQALGQSLVWGYGHIVVFASGAAVGAGFAVVVDVVTGHAEASAATASFAVAIPVATYLLGLWLVRDRVALRGAARLALPVAAATIAVLPIQPVPLEAIAATLVLCVIVRSTLAKQNSSDGAT